MGTRGSHSRNGIPVHQIDALESRRLLSALSVDTSFGAASGFSGAVVADLSATGISRDTPIGIVYDGDGNTVTAGTTDGAWFLQRRDDSGALDISFGQGGTVKLAIPGKYIAASCFIRSASGDLIVGGYQRGSNGSVETFTPVYARFNSDGDLQPWFGSGGILVQPEISGSPSDMIELSSGLLLVGGRSVGEEIHASEKWGTLWRLNPNGTPDESFGLHGAQREDQGTASQYVSSLALTNDGKILAQTSRGIARFNENGTRDLTFAAPGNAHYSPSSGAFAIQSNQKIVVADIVGSSANDVLVSRLTADGLADASFGTSGRTTLDFGYNESVSQVLIAPGDMILIGGTSQDLLNVTGHSAFLSRLQVDGAPDTSFGFGGQILDDFVVRSPAPISADDSIRRMCFGEDGILYTVGTTTVRAIEDAANINSSDNVLLRQYTLDDTLFNLHIDVPSSAVSEGSSFGVSAVGSTYAAGAIAECGWCVVRSVPLFTAFATGVNANVVAADDPSNFVALRVVTADGRIAYASRSVTVLNLPPLASARVPRFAAVGVSASVGGSIVDIVPEAFSLTVDYGDGSAPRTLISSDLRNILENMASRSFKTRGKFVVTVSGDDGDGGTASTTGEISVGDLAFIFYQDKNGNHTFDSVDIPLDGVTAYVDLNANGQFDANEPSDETEADGQVGFTGLGPGNYRTRFIMPAGWNIGSIAADYVDAVVTSAKGVADSIAVISNSVVMGNVWTDSDADGQRDVGEIGRNGVRVYIDSDDDGRPSGEPTATTDAAGNYRIIVPTRLNNTDIVVRRVGYPDVAGTQTFPTGLSGYRVPVASASATYNVDFGVSKSAGGTITGTVFSDLNNNGSYEASDVVRRDRVYLDLNDNSSLDSTEPIATTLSGGYSFAGLNVGTYQVRFIQSAGFVRTLPAAEDYLAAQITGVNTIGSVNFGIHDVAPPVVSELYASFPDTSGLRLLIIVNDLVASLDPSKIHVMDAGTNQPLPADVSLFFGSPVVRPLNAKTFNDGNYRLVIEAGGLTDQSGNVLAVPFSTDFFILSGDANRDRKVDAADLGILASNWQATGKTFMDGDFNFDGKVDIADLYILSSRWQQALPPPVIPAATTPVRRTPSRVATSVLT